MVRAGSRLSNIALGIALSFGLWGGDLGIVSAAEHSPTIDDSMLLLAQLSGKNCSATADVGLSGKQSALFELEFVGQPVAAYLVWSGRDRDNRGDDVVLLNGQPLIADIQRHGESGGGSWWHTYTHDVSDLVRAAAPAGGQLTLTLSGLTIENNLGGENHGAGLIVFYTSTQCNESEIMLFSGLDSFKRTAPAPIYGPHSAVHCASVGASTEPRQIDLQLQIGGIESAERNSTIWLMTSAESTPPASLIGRDDALSFLDPVGNDAAKRQWDRFFASIELPSERTQACVQIESGEPEGVSAVLVTFMAQVHGAGMDGGGANAVSGKVWLDANRDGNQNEGESGIPNIVVLLRDATERTIYQAFVTGSSGDYRFGGLEEGAYSIDVADELFTAEWEQTAESDGILDTEVLVSIESDTTIERVNFGFVPVAPKGLISGTVWSDANGNGIFEDEGDSRLVGINVSLLDNEQAVVDATLTDASGIFTFTDLEFTSYTVQVDSASLPDNSVQTFETDGTLDGSVAVALTEIRPTRTASFGYGMSGYTSGKIWHDQNGDGLQAGDELGIDNVLLLLTDAQGVGRVAATRNGGQYQFDSLPVGRYILRVVAESMPAGAVPTFDVDGALDLQTSFDIEVSTILTNINFGFQFGVRVLEAASPQIDLTKTNIDLNDSDALLDYLLQLLAEPANNGAGEPSDGEQPEEPADNGDSSPTPSPDPDPIGIPDQIDGGGENDDNGGEDDEVDEPFQIHLPVIQ